MTTDCRCNLCDCTHFFFPWSISFSFVIFDFKYLTNVMFVIFGSWKIWCGVALIKPLHIKWRINFRYKGSQLDYYFRLGIAFLQLWKLEYSKGSNRLRPTILDTTNVALIAHVNFMTITWEGTCLIINEGGLKGIGIPNSILGVFSFIRSKQYSVFTR